MRAGYFVTMAAVAAALAAPPLAAQERTPEAELYVASAPPDAVVSLNGEVLGNTPLTVSAVQPGTHLLKLTRRGYRDTLRTVTLAPQQKLPLDLTLEPWTGWILIHSTPPNATVEIGGVDRGRTPLLIADLPFGEYRVRISETGYLARELELNVRDRTPLRLETALTSDSATLTIRSDPPGVQVSVDGIPRGITPCTVSGIPEGERALTLGLPGFAPFVRSVRLAAGQEETLDVRLVPLPAALTVESVPPGARIYIDNRFRGTAPLVLEDLDPGSYSIRAELPAHEPLARTVELHRAAKVVEEFRMQANVGALQITTQPAGVQVFIDGKEIGKTSAKPTQTDQISEPLAADMLAPGEHVLKLAKPGYHVHTVAVTVEREKTAVQHVALRRMFIPDYEVRTETEVVQGVLLQIDPKGNVRMEPRPGIVKTIPADRIVSHGPLRTDAHRE